jgi:hypothetical protein
LFSGPSEIIKHQENGLLVSKRSLPLFAEAITKMCFDKELLDHCRRMQKTSVEKFSREEISKQWDKLLQHER